MKERLTDEDRRSLIAYRLEMAHEALQNAVVNQKNDYLYGAINRIYYACFYAVSALLTSYKYDFGTHHGAKTLFGQHFIATDRIDRKYSTFYGQIFNARNEADYEAFVYYTYEQISEYLEQAREFIEAVQEHVNEEFRR